MLTLVLATLLAPAQAAHGHAPIYRSHDISGALRAGCSVQQVHTPAGKIGNQAAIVRCPKVSRATKR